jgi:hypothetical protein
LLIVLGQWDLLQRRSYPEQANYFALEPNTRG